MILYVKYIIKHNLFIFKGISLYLDHGFKKKVGCLVPFLGFLFLIQEFIWQMRKVFNIHKDKKNKIVNLDQKSFSLIFF